MSIKYMDIGEFIDSGYLQEANRQFFHPLGLALVVACDEDDPDRWWLYGVWDNRDDPEGIVFADNTLSASKADFVQAQLEGREESRLEAVGYVVQPVPDITEDPYDGEE